MSKRFSPTCWITRGSSLEDQARWKDIPWREIIGTRHRLIHAYDRVDLDVLWKIVNDDLPPLTNSLAELLGNDE